MEKSGYFIKANNSWFTYHILVLLVVLFVFCLAIGLLIDALIISPTFGGTFQTLLFSTFPLFIIFTPFALVFIWKEATPRQSWKFFVNPKEMKFQIRDKKTKKEQQETHLIDKLKRVGIKKEGIHGTILLPYGILLAIYIVSFLYSLLKRKTPFNKEEYFNKYVFEFENKTLVLYGGDFYQMENLLDKIFREYGIKFEKYGLGNHKNYVIG